MIEAEYAEPPRVAARWRAVHVGQLYGLVLLAACEFWTLWLAR